MPSIPELINGVLIEFAPTVRNEVDQRLIDGLIHSIPAVRVPLRPYRLWVHSASDRGPSGTVHDWPSRHSDALVVREPMFKAVDISRVNGMKIDLSYQVDPFVKSIVDAIQNNFETFKHRRENFGPLFKKKLGVLHSVEGHDDHIHLAVN
jgi:hypothetical protein